MDEFLSEAYRPAFEDGMLKVRLADPVEIVISLSAGDEITEVFAQRLAEPLTEWSGVPLGSGAHPVALRDLFPDLSPPPGYEGRAYPADRIRTGMDLFEAMAH